VRLDLPHHPLTPSSGRRGTSGMQPLPQGGGGGSLSDFKGPKFSPSQRGRYRGGAFNPHHPLTPSSGRRGTHPLTSSSDRRGTQKIC